MAGNVLSWQNLSTRFLNGGCHENLDAARKSIAPLLSLGDKQKTLETEKPYPLGLPLTSLRDLPLLFVYFPVNNGVLYVLAYVEDIYVRVLSLLVSILNPYHL